MERYKEIERSIIKKYRKEIWSKFIKAVKEYELIKENDKVMVCISGGKDSFLLAKCIQELERHGKVPFTAEYVVMNPGYSEKHRDNILENAKILNVPIRVFESDIFEVVDKISYDSPCYMCAKMRRGYLYSKAKELGCKNTHFMNPNGLWNKDHYTSPYDMALIGRAAMQNENFRTIASTKYYDIGKSNKRKYIDPMGNHHKMLNPGNMPQYGYKYCIGGKTGYTDKCRYTLVTFAKKGNMELVCVVMKVDGSPYMDTNAYTDTTRLFNYCFEKYDKTMIQDDTSNEINKEYLFTNFSPFYSKDTSSLHVDSDAGVILPKGVTLDKTEKKVTYLQTPEKQNGKNVIGHISYTYNGEDVGGADIYYDATDAATLKDSINMTEWFKEAEMTAKKEPFPVKKVMLIVILVICVAGVSCVCVIRIRGYQQKTEYRRRYQKARRHMRKRDRDFYTKR